MHSIVGAQIGSYYNRKLASSILASNVFSLSHLKESCQPEAPSQLNTVAYFPETRRLPDNHNKTMRIRTLTLICDYHLILGPRWGPTTCSNDVLCSKGSKSRSPAVCSGPVSWVSISLGHSLVCFLTLRTWTLLKRQAHRFVDCPSVWVFLTFPFN